MQTTTTDVRRTTAIPCLPIEKSEGEFEVIFVHASATARAPEALGVTVRENVGK